MCAGNAGVSGRGCTGVACGVARVLGNRRRRAALGNRERPAALGNRERPAALGEPGAACGGGGRDG